MPGAYLFLICCLLLSPFRRVSGVIRRLRRGGFCFSTLNLQSLARVPGKKETPAVCRGPFLVHITANYRRRLPHNASARAINGGDRHPTVILTPDFYHTERMGQKGSHAHPAPLSLTDYLQ